MRNALAGLLCAVALGLSAAEQSYSERFLSILDNRDARSAPTPLPAHASTNQPEAKLRLGLSLAEAVALAGRPDSFRGPARTPQLLYPNIRLGFASGLLRAITLYDETARGVRFAGLPTGVMNPAAFIQLFGEPVTDQGIGSLEYRFAAPPVHVRFMFATLLPGGGRRLDASYMTDAQLLSVSIARVGKAAPGEKP